MSAQLSLAQMPDSTRLGDTLAEVRLRNLTIAPPRTIEFEIYLLNRSNARLVNTWQKWANGTFFVRVNNAALAGAVLELDSTALLLRKPLGNEMRTGYELTTKITASAGIDAPAGELGISLLGSDSVENTQTLLPSAEMLLGRFRLRLQDSISQPNAVEFSWKMPVAVFQSNAFKIEQPSAFYELLYGKSFLKNDNAELLTAYTSQRTEIEPPQTLEISRLQAEYAGDKRVSVRWRTTEERIGRRTNAGFVLLRRRLRRGLPAQASPLIPANAPFDTVATFRNSPLLKLTGARNGAAYEYRDSVPVRGDEYAYLLGFADATVRPLQAFTLIFPRDTAFVGVPNAVIALAESRPNPLADKAEIHFRLLDRARVRGEIFDAAGRLIAVPLTETEYSRGLQSFTLEAASLPHLSALFLVLTAYPVNDAAVERSQAVLKLQIKR